MLLRLSLAGLQSSLLGYSFDLYMRLGLGCGFLCSGESSYFFFNDSFVEHFFPLRLADAREGAVGIECVGVLQ